MTISPRRTNLGNWLNMEYIAEDGFTLDGCNEKYDFE